MTVYSTENPSGRDRNLDVYYTDASQTGKHVQWLIREPVAQEVQVEAAPEATQGGEA